MSDRGRHLPGGWEPWTLLALVVGCTTLFVGLKLNADLDWPWVWILLAGCLPVYLWGGLLMLWVPLSGVIVLVEEAGRRMRRRGSETCAADDAASMGGG